MSVSNKKVTTSVACVFVSAAGTSKSMAIAGGLGFFFAIFSPFLAGVGNSFSSDSKFSTTSSVARG